WSDSVLLVSIPEAFASGEGLPPAQEVVFPRLHAQSVNQTIQLPVYGEPVQYPYDHYHFALGLLVRHVADDGSDAPMDANQLPGQRPFLNRRMHAPPMLRSITAPLP